jgi:DNA ligase-1
MINIPRPMKPTKLRLSNELDNLSYPLFAQPKFNGVRCIVNNATCLSNSGKPLPSAFLHRFKNLVNFDGELICGDPTDNDVLRTTVSAVMTVGSMIPVTYYAFDWIDAEPHKIPFIERYKILEDIFSSLKPKNADAENAFNVKLVPCITCHNKEEILAYESVLLEQGHEGVILRDPQGTYKNGRSTISEQKLLALKRRESGTATIVAVNELFNNYNEAYLDELGLTKRSSAKADQYPADMLGSLTVKDCTSNTDSKYYGTEFNIGTGFSLEDRKRLWSMRSKLIGRKVSYTYFGVGIFNKPLHAAYRGLV